MILTRMTIGGEKDRPVVLHAPKNGFLYILDRRDGKLLSAKPIARRELDQGDRSQDRQAHPQSRSRRLVDGAKDRLPRHARRAQLASGEL